MLTNYVSKLGKGVWCYNMPRSTCLPYRTANCDECCYANRGNYCYKTVQEALLRNLDESMRDDFSKLMCAQIGLECTRVGVDRIRLHSSGEFYNERYYKQWCEVAETYPDIRILAYTRNTDIDFSKAPANFVIYFSIDPSTKEINKTCRVRSYLDTRARGIVRHLTPHRNGFVCNSHCHSCDYCWKGVKNVVFFKNMAFRMSSFITRYEKAKKAGQIFMNERYIQSMIRWYHG